MNTDYADDRVLLANSPTRAESMLQSLKQEAGAIGLFVNADKTEDMCFNEKGNISTLNGCSQKLVENFTYIGSSGSSKENDITMRLAMVWTAINTFSIISKSNLSDKKKLNFFPAAVVSVWMLAQSAGAVKYTDCISVEG